MSLKAKIEAVIYAAEEPVTLVQIVGLLGQEAQAELDRIASAQRSLALVEDSAEDSIPLPAEPEDLNQEVFDVRETAVAFDGGSDFDPEDLLADGTDFAENQRVSSKMDGGESPEPEIRAEQQESVVEDVQAPDANSLPETVSETEEAGSAAEQHRDPKQMAREEKERARALRDYLRQLLDELVRDYATSDRGLEIREVAGGFRLATKPEYHDAVRGFVKSLKPPLKLSLQALETLAVVAYKQPVTAPEVSEIRGVDSGGVLGSLMARKLVTTAGRKQVIGRPILYKTTKAFLLRFGLKDINELPSIEEFEKMAGEFAESESVIKPYQEEIPMPQQVSAETAHTDPEFARRNESVEGSVTGANLEEEKDATEPQADGDGATVETVTPDGRMSGINPPRDSFDDTDTSAKEAEVQRNEQNDSQE